MPASPSSPDRRRSLEVARRRGGLKKTPLQKSDAEVVSASGVVERDLTLEEASALVIAEGPTAVSPSVYKPQTLKRDAVLLRKYASVNHRTVIDLAGAQLFVRSVLRVQAHRRGLGRKTTTAESLIDNTCRVIARVWREQKG